MWPSPPPGYVDRPTAEKITGYSGQTIVLAVKLGELKGIQRKKGAPWFFLPADLRAWCGIEETADAS